MKEEIIHTVTGIIQRILKKKPEELRLDYRSSDIEGWDSLRHVMIIADVEDAFGITIGFDELLQIETIADICSVVENHLK